MDHGDTEETRAFWDRVAADWDLQVGDDGDANRRLNSDPPCAHLAQSERSYEQSRSWPYSVPFKLRTAGDG